MLNGTIVFKLTNIGSKSEGLRPFLYLGNGVFEQVWLVDDVSLDGSELRLYDTKKVSVTGEYTQQNIFLIQSIEEE